MSKIKRLINSIKVHLPWPVRTFLRYVKATLRLRMTQSFATAALRLSARNPISMQSKILHKMAYDRNPMLTTYADKVKVRDFVGKKIGPDYLTKSFGVFDNLVGVEANCFPRNFVLKSNHGSGAVVICWDGAPRGTALPENLARITWDKFLIHPDDLEWGDLIRLSSKWMKQNYYWELGRFPEWAYKDIPPQLLVEQVLTHDGNLPEDFKFFMVNGVCKFIQVDFARFSGHKRNLYSPDWVKLEVSYTWPMSEEALARPEKLDEMLRVASALSEGVDFVRVDLYDTDQGVKFGELTNYPDGGSFQFTPKEFGVEIFKDWVPDYSKADGNK